MWLLWTLLAIAYVACWIYFGITTLRKGHYGMFWIGFFDRALVEFSKRYAAQNERDYQKLLNAVESGRITAETGL